MTNDYFFYNKAIPYSSRWSFLSLHNSFIYILKYLRNNNVTTKNRNQLTISSIIEKLLFTLSNKLTNNLYLHFHIKFPIFLLSLSLPIIPRRIGRYFGINKRYKETERRYVWQKEAGKQIVKKISQPSSCGSVGTVHSLRRANNNQQQAPT